MAIFSIADDELRKLDRDVVQKFCRMRPTALGIIFDPGLAGHDGVTWSHTGFWSSTAYPTRMGSPATEVIASCISLIRDLDSKCATAHVDTGSKHEKPILDSLAVVHDAASLIKAHSTKLCLLITNVPFTISALQKVVGDVIPPVDALASAVESCKAEYHTQVMVDELRWRVKQVSTHLLELMMKAAEQASSASIDDDKARNACRATTGLLWQACDAAMQLRALDIGGLLAKKVEEYRELINDALQELREWSEETSDSEDEDCPGITSSMDKKLHIDVSEKASPQSKSTQRDSGDHATTNAPTVIAQKALDDLFTSAGHIPRQDPEGLRPMLDDALKRIKLISLMYQAVKKRRIDLLPKLPPVRAAGSEGPASQERPIAVRIDLAMASLRNLPDMIDELASAFYELDKVMIEKGLRECASIACAVVEILSLNWHGHEDSFTSWGTKFGEAMKQSLVA